MHVQLAGHPQSLVSKLLGEKKPLQTSFFLEKETVQPPRCGGTSGSQALQHPDSCLDDVA